MRAVVWLIGDAAIVYSMPVAIRVGTELNHLEIAVARGLDPQNVELRVSWLDDAGFAGTFSTDALRSDLKHLITGLRRLHRDPSGSFRWTNHYENTVLLKFDGDGLGHFSVSVELTVNHLTGPWVRATFELDQTHLLPIIESAGQATRV